MRKIKLGTNFHFNEEIFQFGKEVIELKDSSKDIHNFQLLKKRLNSDGYLFIRRFHNKSKIIDARNFTLKEIKKDGGLKEGIILEDGLVGEQNKIMHFLES